MDDFSQISVVERIRIMEALWDSFQYDDIVPSPWHAEILKKRKEKLQNGKADFISLAELKSMSKKSPI